MIPGVVVPPGPAAQEYEKAATSLLCDCGCSPQSIKECACSRAEDLRVSLAADAGSGRTAEEIIAGYVARHGEKILVAPPASGFNLLAWIGPGIGFLGAALVVVAVIHRWKRASAGAPTPAEAPRPPIDDADLARLARDLEELR
jgi:cytochrome c-type biogenesis protein CcmH/NrfF